MGDENHIRTLGDYSKPSHEGYRNTIELPVWNNVVPLRSDTIRLVQNGCAFHRLRFEYPYQHLKDFLKLVESLDLDGSQTLPPFVNTTKKPCSSSNAYLHLPPPPQPLHLTPHQQSQSRALPTMHLGRIPPSHLH
nr:MAK10-like protein [Tanacetum cinerariifolium]